MEMVITRAFPRVAYLEIHAPLPDRIDWKLQCGRAYDRCIRQVAARVVRKDRQKSAPRLTRVERWAATAGQHTVYGDFEIACLREIPFRERGAARDKAISEAARAWRLAGRR